LYFDRETGEIGETYVTNIDIESCLEYGLAIDGETLKWWFKQSNRTFLNTPRTLPAALNTFATFIEKAETVWAHATFDIPVLANAYRAAGIKFPFRYWKSRDIRTLVDLANMDREAEKRNEEKRTDAHDALADCRYQVAYCVRCFEALKSPERDLIK
jgi:hypothetical protein